MLAHRLRRWAMLVYQYLSSKDISECICPSAGYDLSKYETFSLRWMNAKLAPGSIPGVFKHQGFSSIRSVQTSGVFKQVPGLSETRVRLSEHAIVAEFRDTLHQNSLSFQHDIINNLQ